MGARKYRQPPLHELVTVLRAPSVVLGDPDGQLRTGGAHGFYRDDRRVLSRCEVDVDGVVATGVGHRLHEAQRASFVGELRGVADAGADSLVSQRRHRLLTDDALVERIELVSAAAEPITVRLRARVESDLTWVSAVKGSEPVEPAHPEVAEHTVRWERDGGRVTLSADRPADSITVDGATAVLAWDVPLERGRPWPVELRVLPVERPDGFLARRPAVVPRLTPPADLGLGDRADRLLRRSLSDLDGLMLTDPEVPDAVFLAAGSPWYFTLFGRDSLWAARLLLGLGTEIAGGTLRALAARQGRRDDPRTEEQPGRILHEIRRADLGGMPEVRLPPVYYGTADATALWVCLLHDAWRAGLPEDQVRALLPNLRAALDWIAGPADADGDGFAEYAGADQGGLANQGWKDSADGVRWADGRIAERPLALCEVQGYAHAAACYGADLLDAFGEPGGQHWREWAAALRERFRAAFWVTDAHGRYPAIALDRDKRPVTGPASNMGHLLGTGLLTAEEARLVADRLVESDLDSGYGLRTLSSRTAGFNPQSYHCGSVWTHDTAITVLGMAAEGQHEQARRLAEGLLAAAERFDYRMPELHGGTDARAGDPVAAYPASCRPQAWSAAGAVAVLGYLAGWPHPMVRWHTG